MNNSKLNEKEVKSEVLDEQDEAHAESIKKKKIAIVVLIFLVCACGLYFVFKSETKTNNTQNDTKANIFSDNVDDNLNKKPVLVPDISVPTANNSFDINNIKKPEAPKIELTPPTIVIKTPEAPKIDLPIPKPVPVSDEKVVLPPIFGPTPNNDSKANISDLTPPSTSNTGSAQETDPKIRKRNANVILFGGASVDKTPEEKKKEDMISLINGNYGKKKTKPSSFAKITDSYVGLKDRMILAGKVMQIVLETRITTASEDGMMRGIISTDVYAESGFNVLIPAGSRIIGSYNTKKKGGDKGKSQVVEIALSRIVRPDGIDIILGGMPITDSLGATGAKPDKVYTGTGRAIMNSTIIGAITLGSLYAAQKINSLGNTSSKNNSQSLIPNININSNGSDYASSATDAVNSIADMLKQQFPNAQPEPILIANQGKKLSLMVDKDIIFSDENAFVFQPGEINALLKENCNEYLK
jgi:type IV secretion system protein VirB10